MRTHSGPELILGGGAIRVFGDVADRLPARAAWNDPAGWRSAYADIPIPGEVIAESFLGDQYLLADELVGRWDPETGDIESTGLRADAWLAGVRGDASTHEPAWLLDAWERTNGSLPVTQHLAPKQPFVLGGAFEPENLFATDARSDLEWRAQLARQLRDLPDGAQVRIDVRWED